MSGHTHSHDHRVDADKLIAAVQSLSKARGERMTDVRRDVLMALAAMEKPEGAYAILAELNKKRATKLSAMSLYRTLDFLIELGVVIKLESTNTYRLCGGHGQEHSHLLMVCDQCGDMQEVADDSAAKKLQALARKHGHRLKHHVIELHGACVKCDAAHA